MTMLHPLKRGTVRDVTNGIPGKSETPHSGEGVSRKSALWLIDDEGGGQLS